MESLVQYISNRSAGRVAKVDILRTSLPANIGETSGSMHGCVQQVITKETAVNLPEQNQIALLLQNINQSDLGSS